MGFVRRVAARALTRVRANPVQSAGYILLTAIGFVLMWMAVVLALRTGLLGFTVGDPPTSRELTTFATFIGGGFATAATMFGALLTAEHNGRERRRLAFDTIVRSLEAIPAGTPQRLAGTLSTAVLIGQPGVAVRILEPAWKAGEVDNATATWIIDEVLAGGPSVRADHLDGEVADNETLIEAASLLLQHAERLADAFVQGEYAFPGHFMDAWDARRELPPLAKKLVLQSMAVLLLSRDWEWWFGNDGMMDFPLQPWLDCALKEGEEESVRSAAAALFSALRSCFPEKGQRRYETVHPEAKAIAKDFRGYREKADGECFDLAEEIAEKWRDRKDVAVRVIRPA